VLPVAYLVSRVFFVAWRRDCLSPPRLSVSFHPSTRAPPVVSQPGVPLILQSLAYKDRRYREKIDHFVSLVRSNLRIYSREFYYTHFYILPLFFVFLFYTVGQPLILVPSWWPVRAFSFTSLARQNPRFASLYLSLTGPSEAVIPNPFLLFFVPPP